MDGGPMTTKTPNTLREEAESLAKEISHSIIHGIDVKFIDLVTPALQSAFNAGAEAMRRDAVKSCEQEAKRTMSQAGANNKVQAAMTIAEAHKAEGDACVDCSEIIRDLPLPAYGEKK